MHVDRGHVEYLEQMVQTPRFAQRVVPLPSRTAREALASDIAPPQRVATEIGLVLEREVQEFGGPALVFGADLQA